MSSKLFLPEDGKAAEAMVWRRVGESQAGQSHRQGQPDSQMDTLPMQREWERRVEEARAAGRREGEAAGRNRAAAEVQPVLERLARSIEEMAHLRGRLRREAEGDLVRLSVAIARRVLRRELAVDPDALRGLVLGALEKLQGQENCRVRVHPAHAPQVQQYMDRSGVTSKVEVVADAGCEPGAVVFETQRGNLDASLETQLQEIERGLADRLRQHS